MVGIVLLIIIDELSMVDGSFLGLEVRALLLAVEIVPFLQQHLISTEGWCGQFGHLLYLFVDFFM